MLADLLARLPASDLLAELIEVLRGGEPTTTEALRALEARVERALADAPAAPPQDVWRVARWFAARAEQALRDENRRLVTMLDALPDHLMMLDRDSRLLFVNRSSADLAGAVLGRPRDAVVGFSVLDGEQPDAFKQYALDLVARAVAGETFSDEFVLPGPDGPQWRETHMAPVYGRDGTVEAVAAASRDIHARKQAEARLLLLSKIGGLVGTDSAGVLARVPGASIPELADVALLELLEPGAARVEVAHRDPAALGALQPGASVAEMLRALGALTTLEIPIVVLGAPIARATFAYTPASGRRHGPGDREIAEEVVRRVAQIVENARLHEEVAQALGFRERVMGILGHDLRNPLAAVLSLSTLLAQRADVPERAKEGLGHIRRSAERMEQMIHTLLDFTQLRFRGAPPLTLESFALDTLARAIVDELQVAQPARSITLETRGDLRGRWDYTRMGQVISNLVGNALTHGARESPIRVELAGEAGSVHVAVTNHGPVIPADALAKLFEPFWQPATDATRRGLGLGLFIAQQIVHSHGGAIEVRSQDASTTFTVRLPQHTP